MNSAVQSLSCIAVCSLASLFLLIGCGGEASSVEVVVSPPPEVSKDFDPMALELSDPALIEGREIWTPRCGQCHISGLGGAPKIGDRQAWAPRIAQGKEVLYDHAINGFSGPKMLVMPPKGGFDELTNDQIRLAVDFVVHASQ